MLVMWNIITGDLKLHGIFWYSMALVGLQKLLFRALWNHRIGLAPCWRFIRKRSSTNQHGWWCEIRENSFWKSDKIVIASFAQSPRVDVSEQGSRKIWTLFCASPRNFVLSTTSFHQRTWGFRHLKVREHRLIVWKQNLYLRFPNVLYFCLSETQVWVRS